MAIHRMSAKRRREKVAARADEIFKELFRAAERARVAYAIDRGEIFELSLSAAEKDIMDEEDDIADQILQERIDEAD